MGNCGDFLAKIHEDATHGFSVALDAGCFKIYSALGDSVGLVSPGNNYILLTKARTIKWAPLFQGKSALSFNKTEYISLFGRNLISELFWIDCQFSDSFFRRCPTRF